MRIKEWYSWHYPELARIVPDNYIYVQLTNLIGNRQATEVTVDQVEELVLDGEIAEKVIESSLNSMGQ